ncbi:hypothetical protein [Aquirufa antheringensis]|uniref:hypothetical protein n=1 Tax=Aquirufa antheringensis TaxID=2516559 RepID=UPI001032F11A|nr:hypothetical protein [Aquirufa antheringensis]MCE4217339.1 hypothetical protein [Pseudarcicella sp. GAP-15]MCZ2478581.1 hypothetical protein [Aquirufa antheringensis]TBH72396.1 hypothetical protein EWU21_00410 [Aquirufa antheringensis]
MSWGAYSGVMIATGLKFIAGPITGFSLGLTWYETVFFTWLGAMLMVTFIITSGKAILGLVSKYRTTKPKLFSKRVRYAVDIWQRFGIKGIAALMPLIFTPIGGSLLALSFKVPTARILFFMGISSLIWALIYVAGIYQLTFLRDMLVH